MFLINRKLLLKSVVKHVGYIIFFNDSLHYNNTDFKVKNDSLLNIENA